MRKYERIWLFFTYSYSNVLISLLLGKSFKTPVQLKTDKGALLLLYVFMTCGI